MFGNDADVFLQALKINRNKENTSSPTYQTKYIVKFIEMWKSQNKDNATIGRFLELLEGCLTESDFRQTYRKIKNDVLGKTPHVHSVYFVQQGKLTATLIDNAFSIVLCFNIVSFSDYMDSLELQETNQEANRQVHVYI